MDVNNVTKENPYRTGDDIDPQVLPIVNNSSVVQPGTLSIESEVQTSILPIQNETDWKKNSLAFAKGCSNRSQAFNHSSNQPTNNDLHSHKEHYLSNPAPRPTKKDA